MKWQPIETAPKDGSIILVSGGDLGYDCPTIVSAFWDDGWHLDQWNAPQECINPTQWFNPQRAA